MKQIQAIYREEGKLKDLKTEERLKQRQLVIKPLVDALFAYAKQHQVPVGTQGKLARAVTYLLNQEKHLRVFLENGALFRLLNMLIQHAQTTVLHHFE